MDDSPAVRLAVAVLTLAGIALMAWLEMPPWQRELAARAARTRLHRAAGQLARASGHRAMGRELSGAPESDAGYGIAYRFSRLRDSL